MRIKTLLLLFLFSFCFFPCLGLVQAEENSEDIVSSAEELSQWLESHADTGGSVRLERSIEWRDYLSIHATVPLTIDTGSHSIHLNPLSYLGLTGPVTVEGTPSPGNAIFDAEANAQLAIGTDTVIRARGTGAVAVRTRWSQNFSPLNATVEAIGTNATAIEVAGGTLSFYYARIYAQGENAACIDATQGSVDVFFSILKATGQSAVSVRSNDASIIDVSSCQPEPENAVVIPASSHDIYISVSLSQEIFHKSILDSTPLPERVSLVFGATAQVPERGLSLDWTPDATLPDAPGQYEVPGVLDLSEDFLQLIGGRQPTLSIQLVDPAKPYLKPTFAVTPNGIYSISYFQTLNAHDHQEALYISEDMGKTWQYVPSGDSKQDSFISYNHLKLKFRNYFEPDKTYLLVMETESPEISGFSNILELTLSSDRVININNFNGDRDFSDREDDTVSTTPGPPDTESGVKADAPDVSTTYNQSQILELVAANPDSTTFFGSGIQASISSQTLAQLLPEENDVLTVHCTLIGGSSYRIELIKNGTESIDFSETPLRVRVNCRLRENETFDQLSFKTEDGVSASIVSYDEETGQLELLVTSAGIYTLSSVWTAPASTASVAAAPGTAGWIILSALMALAIAGLVIFRRMSRTT